MANPGADMRVRFMADLANIKRGLGVLRGEIAGVKASAAKPSPFGLNTSRARGDVNAVSGGIRSLIAQARTFIGVWAGFAGGKALAGLADEATILRGRLKNAKVDYAEIFALAQRTRTGLSSTATLYAQMERSTRSQNRSKQELLQLTEAVNQAVKLSYATESSGEAAIIQLTQAMGSGVLRGEELNSIMEQTPRLAEAIAAGLNVPLGQLRTLAKDGKLTSDAVFSAVISQSKVLKGEFSDVPITIADAWTAAKNNLLQYIGNQDQASGASSRFAGIIKDIGKNLPKYLDPLLDLLGPMLQSALKALPGLARAVATGFQFIGRHAGLITFAIKAFLALSVAKWFIGVAVSTGTAVKGIASMISTSARLFNVLRAGKAGLIAWQAILGNGTVAACVKAGSAISAFIAGPIGALMAIAAVGIVIPITIAISEKRELEGQQRKITGTVGNLQSAHRDSLKALRNAKTDEERKKALEAARKTQRATLTAQRQTKQEIDKLEKDRQNSYGSKMMMVSGTGTGPAAGPIDLKRHNQRAGEQKKKDLEAINQLVASNATLSAEIARVEKLPSTPLVPEVPGLDLSKLLGGDKDKDKNKGGGAGKKDKPEESIIATVDQIEVALDKLKAAQEALDASYEDGSISIADYFAKKQEMQLQDIDYQIQQQQATLKNASSSDEASRAATELVKLQRQRAAVAGEVSTAEKKALQELADEYQKVTDRIAELNGDAAANTRTQLEREFGALIKKLELNGQTAQAAVVRGFIDSSVVKAQIEQFSSKTDEIVNKLRNSESSISAQAGAGMMGQAESERQMATLRANSLQQLRELRVAAAAYLQTLAPGSKEAAEAIAGLQKIDESIANVKSASQKMRQGIEDAGVNALVQGFNDIVDGQESVGRSALKMASNFAKAVAQMIIQQQALLAMKWIMSAFGGTAAPVNHSGGVVGSGGGRMRQGLNPVLFGMAPRFHSGGFPGLRQDEVAAVLQRGEEVITARDPRHRRNGGGLSGGAVANNTVNFSFTFSDGGVSKNKNESQGNGEGLADALEGPVLNIVHREMRPGGIIWTQLNG